MAERRWSERDLALFFSLAQTGIEMVAPIGAGVLLDSVLGSKPWCTLIGVVLGPTIAIWHMTRLLDRYNHPKPPS